MMSVPVVTTPEFQAGQPIELFTGTFGADEFGNRSYDVTADGERFVMILQTSSPIENVKIVFNWFEELKRLAPTGR